jgi:hypothetical protein
MVEQGKGAHEFGEEGRGRLRRGIYIPRSRHVARVSPPSRCASGDGGHAAPDSVGGEGADKRARMPVKREGNKREREAD